MKKGFYLGLGLIGVATTSFAQTTPDNTLSDCEKQKGFSQLYDGTIQSFRNNFVDYIKGNTANNTLNSEWKVDDATKSVNMSANLPDVRSKRIFKNFDFRVTYKCPGNEGIYYRFDTRYDAPWLSGIEFAIDDNTGQNARVTAGAVYDVYEPNPPASKSYHSFNSTNPWNEVRIVVIGDSVEHWMNGSKIVSFRYFSDDYFSKYAGSKWPNNGNTMSFAVAGDKSKGPIQQGYLGFQADHGGEWFMKNMRIDTVPNWTTSYSWPPPTNCTTSEIGVAGKKSSPLVSFSSDGLSLMLPSEKIKSAELITISGEKVAFGKIGTKGSMEFSQLPKKSGIYVLRYASSTGIHSISVSLINKY